MPKKISELSAVSSPVSTDVLPVVNGGTTQKITIAQIATAQGIVPLDRGGLNADVSAYSGLVSISGGVSSAVAAPTGAIVGTTDTQTLTNKTISGASNTLSNIAISSLAAGSCSISCTNSYAGSLNLSTEGTLDWFGINASTSAWPLDNAGKSKHFGCQKIRLSFAWNGSASAGIGVTRNTVGSVTFSSDTSDTLGSALSSNQTAGFYRLTTNKDHGFAFAALATPGTTRTLKIYAEIKGIEATLTVKTPDGSFADVTDVQTVADNVVKVCVWTVTYSTRTAGEIFVKCICTANYSTGSNQGTLSFSAATVA